MQTTSTTHSQAGNAWPSSMRAPTGPDAPVNAARSDYVWLPRLAGRKRRSGNDVLSQALGWFSIGAGVAELMAPRRIGRASGTGHHPWLMRALGAREIVSGIGILAQPRQPRWMWARVAGDAMDLALLALAASSGKSVTRKKKVAVATVAIAGITALDVLCGVRQTQQAGVSAGRASGEIDIEKSITINRPPEECYLFWRDFRNLGRFMQYVEEVELLSDKISHWRVKGPAGTAVEWDAELSVDHPQQLLAWHSVGDADVDNAGTVRFEPAPGGRGTILRVELQYKPPAGKAGASVAKLMGEEPAQQLDEDLRRFKQLIETGEIPTTLGQPSGQRGWMTRLFSRQPGEQR
ncbi:MAG: SRPBCC family protein [Burkholderiales bacterium]|nr:SRPBCC family protein [Burkholderiales bacterium]